MFPHQHPYDMVPARPLSPPEEPWRCHKCRQVCDAWHCQICREIQCGFDDGNPVEVFTLTEGRKLACRDCAEANLDDCAVRDLKQARAILSEIRAGDRGELDLEYDNFETAPNVAIFLGHSLEYLDRRTAAERGIGYSEFVMEMLQDSLAALKKPVVSTEAHNYAAIYTERFGEVANA